MKRSGIFLVGTLGLLLSLGACGKIDHEKAEAAIRGTLESKFPEAKITVTCPEGIKLEKGDVFHCDVDIDGEKMKAKVVQQDSKGSISWEINQESNLGAGTARLVKKLIVSDLGAAKDAVQVQCPEDIEAKEGGTFECTAEVDGIKLTAGVKQLDTEGNVSYKLIDGVVNAQELKNIIEANLAAKNVKAQVQCEKPLYLSKPGTSFECQATDVQGEARTVVVKINDEHGNINWEIDNSAGSDEKPAEE